YCSVFDIVFQSPRSTASAAPSVFNCSRAFAAPRLALTKISRGAAVEHFGLCDAPSGRANVSHSRSAGSASWPYGASSMRGPSKSSPGACIRIAFDCTSGRHASIIPVVAQIAASFTEPIRRACSRPAASIGRTPSFSVDAFTETMGVASGMLAKTTEQAA
ncbi:hypothetical protein M885DRAFT_605083, partial [Pelagophyceae sp. CCMP2097]